ncbi:MAG: hypothetical protein BGO69_16445 [Bacteroidetes bacterium 46-16]|nr:MAG: hypothetical protein BGO69_16445 [Bacteroidetes bacterium 46-16]
MDTPVIDAQCKKHDGQTNEEKIEAGLWQQGERILLAGDRGDIDTAKDGRNGQHEESRNKKPEPGVVDEHKIITLLAIKRFSWIYLLFNGPHQRIKYKFSRQQLIPKS